MVENPISKEWRERYSKLPTSIKEKLDELDKKNSMTNELLPIKRSRKAVKTGDVFVIQPKEGLYIYGKVLNANIEQPYDKFKQYEGGHVIVISKMTTDKIILPEVNFDYSKLLIPPKIVTKACWTQGYFYTVDNIPLNEEEENLDYGFYDTVRLMFRKEDGEELDHRPNLLGTYAIGSFGAVAYEVTKELIINSELIKI